MNLKKFAITMSLCALLSGCGNTTPEEKVEKRPERRVYTVLEIEKTPKKATLDMYLVGESVQHQIGYEGMSKVLRELNDDKRAFHSGHKEGIVYFHPDRKIRAPDYNSDGKIFGEKGKPVGVFEVYR